MERKAGRCPTKTYGPAEAGGRAAVGPTQLRQRIAQARCSVPNPERKKSTKAGESKVKVEVLYVAECPSHPAAVRLVKDNLAAGGVAAEIHEVLVSDEEMASELRFTGSPTIRINGKDVAGECQDAPGFALSCRLYPGSKLQQGRSFTTRAPAPANP